MRRLKHSPELVAWGEAYLTSEYETGWGSESIYPIMNIDSINILEGCELPLGQYLLKTFDDRDGDSVYINCIEFEIVKEMLDGGYYVTDGLYDAFNGEMVIFNVSYYVNPDTNKAVANIYTSLSAPGQDEGNLTFKLWRIA